MPRHYHLQEIPEQLIRVMSTIPLSSHDPEGQLLLLFHLINKDIATAVVLLRRMPEAELLRIITQSQHALMFNASNLPLGTQGR
jgi:hypothetical protein